MSVRARVACVRAPTEACCVGGAKRLEKGARPGDGISGAAAAATSTSRASSCLAAARCVCKPGRQGCCLSPLPSPPPTLACPLTAGELKSRRSGALLETIACPASLGRLADCGTGGSKLSSLSCSLALRFRPERVVGQRATLARAPLSPLKKPTISSGAYGTTAVRAAHFDAIQAIGCCHDRYTRSPAVPALHAAIVSGLGPENFLEKCVAIYFRSVSIFRALPA